MKKLHYYLLSLLLVAPVTFAAIGEPTPDLKNKVFNQAYEKRPMLAMLFENITNLMQTSIGATFAIIYTISVVLGFIGFKMMHKGAVKKDGGDPEGLKFTYAGGITFILATLMMGTTGYVQLMADTWGIGNLVHTRLDLTNKSVRQFVDTNNKNGFVDITNGFGVENRNKK